MTNQNNVPYISCLDLFKIYKAQDLEVVALRGLDLDVMAGEMIGIVGASGSGKSTFLNILAGYDKPSAGEIRVGERNLLHISAKEAEDYRLHNVGFVWQQTARNLVPYLTALENVELPMILAGFKTNYRIERAKELLEAVGLSHRLNHKPNQLSGGEQQRVAIAIALSNEPELLLADEPTGELDSETANEILDIFKNLRDIYQTTIIIVTHDEAVSTRVDRVVVVRDGRASAEIVSLPDFRRPGDGSANISEFILVDSSGRLQLPREYVDNLRIKGRARLVMEENHVVVYPESER
ncbi:MAG: ABC transporter ATP-binding protein [Dehalococcoidia bacterium]